MTKEEVKQNIRYNENLVNQYQRRLNSLNQQVNSLNSTVRQLNAQNNDLVSRKKKLEGELAELGQLKNKVQNLRDEFSSRQTRRMTGYNRNIGSIFTTNFFSSYINGMKSLLSGSEYRNAYNGLSSAVDKVVKKIKEKDREVDSVVKQINDVRRRIDNATLEIRSCRSQISQTESDLAYRRRRIQYWKDKLKYAT